ncbi:MAG: branched-chain amino acid ABC transporter permease [Actinomycetota bacterium]|jgi:branched-chain amino acid transport system permease protein|nr:branched-chain amino acid ABC transporter permease [Actinomycetota bacterium]
MGTLLVEALIDGVLTGGLYALMAAGLTLIFGMLEIINIAQGIFVVLGSYLSYALWAHLGIDPFLGLLITVPALFFVGVGAEWAFLRRLGDRDRVSMSILVTYAISLVIEGILDIVFGTTFVQIRPSYSTSTWHVFGFYLPDIYVYGFALAVVLLAALFALMYRTRFGASLRAALQDRTAASLIGVNVKRVSTITFGIGVAATAAGGMVFGVTNGFNANSSLDLISRLLAIVVLGGLGSMGGAMGAALAMLVIEDVVAVVWSPVWSPVIYFLALLVVLSVRPQGLFGKVAARAQ